MIASIYATYQDNSTHGEDSFLVKDLGGGNFLDVVLDGVTGHGGEEASQVGVGPGPQRGVMPDRQSERPGLHRLCRLSKGLD